MSEANDAVPESAREQLKLAMRLHAADRVDEALVTAREAIQASPSFGEAHAYIGNTLVTRKRLYMDGLEALQRAVALLPRDATVRYTYGWCLEFVANAMSRRGGRRAGVDRSSEKLYADARRELLHALELDPDDALRGDIEDMLDVIAAVTGEPWQEGDIERVAPRPR